MKVEIIDRPLTFILHGFSGIASNKDYAGTAFKLMSRLWQIVKSNNLKNKGFNIWVYEENEIVFAGVELIGVPKQHTVLEQKNITLLKYALYKHICPYHQIGKSVQQMTNELKSMGFETSLPYIEYMATGLTTRLNSRQI
jgi:hypothetical protein